MRRVDGWIRDSGSVFVVVVFASDQDTISEIAKITAVMQVMLPEKSRWAGTAALSRSDLEVSMTRVTQS